MADGWAKFGAALGGDSEDSYEQGRALGAKTEDALASARRRVMENDALARGRQTLIAAGVPEANADAAYTSLAAGGKLEDPMQVMLKNQEYGFRQTAGDPMQDFTHRNIALQGLASAPVERFGAAGEGMYQDKFSEAQPTVSPVGQALIDQRTASGNLSQQRADHPEQFHYQSGATGDSDIDAALSKAVAEGRLDPSRVNSRTAAVLGKIALANPTLNFNRMTADAALQKNSTFQQRAMTLESLPDVMNTMVQLGHKVGFDDNRTIGKMQAWYKGEFNDPDLQEYMTVRNDALMTIANVMRGVGMSDQAHRAEIEAANPTMSPKALDAWLRGQTASLEPRLGRMRNVTHLGDVPNAAPATAAPAQIKSDAEFDALPPGTEFIAPDGSHRRKP